MSPIWDTIDLESYLSSIVNEDNIEEQLVQEARWKISYRESQLERRELHQLHQRAVDLDEESLD
jgi:hypothetical protein